jgi:hypothetical protein
VVAATIATGRAPMPTRDDVIAALRPGAPTAEATAAAAELSPADARDRAWFGIEQLHHTGQDLQATAAAYLDIARHSEQDHRATGAWFLYAWTNWRLGDSVRTGAALDHIYAIDPAYSAAHLLEAALQDGLNPATVPPLHRTPDAPGNGVARYQVTWTRLSGQMGYADSPAKRTVIRAAIDAMTWVDPSQLATVLHVPPARQLVGGLFYGRRWALHRGAVVDLPPDSGLPPGTDGAARLIGLWSLTGDRHVLLNLGHETLNLLRERPAVT